jgi:hypothetical protein
MLKDLKPLSSGQASVSMTAFAQIFRSDINRHVEYSFDEDPTSQGTMTVGSGEGFLARVQRFSKDLPYGQIWTQDVETFVKCANPPAYFLRVDGNSTDINDVTFYSRFFTPIDKATLTATLSQLSTFSWTGPPPHEFGHVVESEGPQGVGLRIDTDGQCSIAIYYNVVANRDDFCKRLLRPLVKYLGWTDQVATLIAEDVFALYSSGKMGVVGLGADSTGSTPTLKLDAFNVALGHALEFLVSKGTASSCVSRLAHTVHSLRSEHLNYVGIKYNASGFIGWKFYVALQPAHEPNALNTRFLLA